MDTSARAHMISLVCIIKVDLKSGTTDPPTRMGALTFNDTDENHLFSAVTDGTFGYFGTYTTPGRVIKVQLSGTTTLAQIPTRVGALTLDADEDSLTSAVMVGTYGYFGTANRSWYCSQGSS